MSNEIVKAIKISKQFFDAIDVAYKGKEGTKNTLSSFALQGIMGNTVLLEDRDFEIIPLENEIVPCMWANDLRYSLLQHLDSIFRERKFKACNVKFLTDSSGRSLSFSFSSKNDIDLIHASICNCADSLLCNNRYKFRFEVVSVANHYCFMEVNQ